MGQEASFEEFPWARALRLVFRGERDALFTALRNEERARFCYFPDEPLLREKWVFFVRAADVGRLKFSSFEDLGLAAARFAEVAMLVRLDGAIRQDRAAIVPQLAGRRYVRHFQQAARFASFCHSVLPRVASSARPRSPTSWPGPTVEFASTMKNADAPGEFATAQPSRRGRRKDHWAM
jgi:hypothetical protein